KIELGKVAAPFLRPISIERIRVTSQTGAATQIELNAERAVLHLSLVKILAGRSDGVRTLSIQAARAEIRRDYSEKVRAMPFNWTALQSLLPANFDIAHPDLRVENEVGNVEIGREEGDRKSTRLNSSHQILSHALFCL